MTFEFTHVKLLVCWCLALCWKKYEFGSISDSLKDFDNGDGKFQPNPCTRANYGCQ